MGASPPVHPFRGVLRCCSFFCGFEFNICYDSFLFIRRSSLDSLLYLRTVLRNALRLNAASLLHAVHGSLVLFPLTFYGRPSRYTCLPQRRLFPSIALPKPSFYIHLSSYATNTAWSVRRIFTYLNDDISCTISLT